MRAFAAIPVGLALLVSFAGAPLAHEHRRDPAHRHAQPAPHAHLRVAPHGGPSLERPDDDDVIPIDWLLSAADTPQFLLPVHSEPAAAPLPPAPYELVRTPSPRAHDPPTLAATPPRAPPV